MRVPPPVPSLMGSAPRFSGERTNNQLQGHYSTIYCVCQQLIFIILYFYFVKAERQGLHLLLVIVDI